LERERIQREEQQGLEQERIAREEAERQRLERERIQREEQQGLENERIAREQQESTSRNNNGSGATLLGCGKKPEREFDTEAIALIQIQINPDGEVTSALVAQSSGNNKLDKLAMKFARTCRFTDSANGETMTIKINFVQPGSQREREANQRVQQGLSP